MPIWNDKLSDRKIPDKRLFRLNPKEGLTGRPLQELQQKDSAWNAALAMSHGEKVELILIKQALYPLHLVGKSDNYFILLIKGYGITGHPGKMDGAQRPDYIGPLYNRIKYWAPFPIWESISRNMPETQNLNLYQLLKDIKNGRPNKHWTEEQLKMADELIRRRAVVY